MHENSGVESGAVLLGGKPPPHTLLGELTVLPRSPGERCKLPQQGMGHSPS